jgi:hypothetical protein
MVYEILYLTIVLFLNFFTDLKEYSENFGGFVCFVVDLTGKSNYSSLVGLVSILTTISVTLQLFEIIFSKKNKGKPINGLLGGAKITIKSWISILIIVLSIFFFSAILVYFFYTSINQDLFSWYFIVLSIACYLFGSLIVSIVFVLKLSFLMCFFRKN